MLMAARITVDILRVSIVRANLTHTHTKYSLRLYLINIPKTIDLGERQAKHA